MKTLFLHGSLGARFGESFSLDVRDPAEALRALLTQIPGFEAAIRDGDWHVVRGRLDDGDSLDEEGLLVGVGEDSEIHILPAISGAGGDGIWQTIAGAVLIVASFWAGPYGPMLFNAGVALALGGVAQMLSPTPQTGDYGERERPDERPSFLFDGPVNTSTQGLPVPVIYGRIKTGSVVASAGMTSEELDA
ncbi:tail assembly protein [Halomonas sp. V046]|uniref:tail assembly protein n=1 Tax=Halomonas sp. V046 TaxID=3459611 RepID=UPI004043D46C